MKSSRRLEKAAGCQVGAGGTARECRELPTGWGQGGTPVLGLQLPVPPPATLQPGGQEGGSGWRLLHGSQARGGSNPRPSQGMLSRGGETGKSYG